MFRNRLITRRNALWLGLATLAGTGVVVARRDSDVSEATQPSDPNRDFTVAGTTALKERAAAKGLLYGAAAFYDGLSDRELSTVFAQECGILVPENELKWQAIRPSPDRFDFTKGDRLAEYAQAHNLLMRGHTLVWNQALPDWFEEIVNRQNAEQFMVEHIDTVVRHYAGRMHSWDVVNESVVTRVSNRADGLNATPWLRFLGKDYIDIAFRAAAQADPQALLVLNEAKLDYDDSESNHQRDATLGLLEHLKAMGTPIHALGVQAHLEASETRFNPIKLRNFLRDVASLGLKVLITELDVKDHHLPADIVERDRAVAATYEDYLSVVLDEPAVIAVLTWGLSDRHSWLSNYASRSDGLPVRPLPLDANLGRKLAWNAIAQSFERASRRS